MNRIESTPTTANEVKRRSPWFALAVGLCCVIGGIILAFSLMRDGQSPAPVQPNIAQEALADLEQRKFKPLSEPLTAILADPAYQSIPTQTHPLLGQQAPDFTLSDTNDKPIRLSDTLKQGPVVLVFYYGYYCNHCVSQLFALNKDFEKFRELGVTVLAVSADPTEETRERFKQYGAFSFPVLSDPSNLVAAQYGTFTPSKKAGEEGQLMHGTFVIDRKGHIVWANRGDSPFTENRTLLVEISRLERPELLPKR
ncbi:MAG: redoxin domain-containing protein [Zavarzinella sp.]